MSEIFDSTDDFKKIFKFDEYPEYGKYKLTPFLNAIGFSIQRPYPLKYKYKPPVDKHGNPDVYALIAVQYKKPAQPAEGIKRLPIYVNASVFSRYVSTHPDYNFADEDCPTEESIVKSKKTPRPINLSDKYRYDHVLDRIIDDNGNAVDGIGVLNNIYEQHVATVGTFKGWVLRWLKIAWRDGTAGSCGLLTDLFKRILRNIFGRSLEPDDVTRGIFTPFLPDDVKLLKTERIDVFGYSASKNVIITFSFIILVGYSFYFFFDQSWPWFSNVSDSNLLSFAFCVLVVYLLEHFIPSIIFRIINSLIKMRWIIMNKEIKFK